MNKLKVALVQAELVWEDPEQNRTNLLKEINELNIEVDIIILPEMFTTGFTMNPSEVYETMSGSTVQWMRNIASEKNCAICGSIIIKEDNNYYNRFLFVESNGYVSHYDKRHTFTLAGEDKVYKAGEKKLIIEYKGWKICPLICYDLRFPVWARNVENYDLLIYVANWPNTRISAWDTLLKARAIENMSYCIGVNRVGKDSNKLEYNGHSTAFDGLGDELLSTFDAVETIGVIELEKSHLKEIRDRLRFLDDKDSFMMN